MVMNMDIKKDFPIFEKYPNLAYFDSSSTALIPKISIDATMHFLTETIASARRGAYHLVTSSNTQIENVRGSLAEFLQVQSSEVSFQNSVPTAVASILYGYPWKSKNRDKVVIAENEEHSALASTLRAAEVMNLDIEFLPIDQNGTLVLDNTDSIIDDRTGIVVVGQTVLGNGSKNPVNEISNIAHGRDAIVLSDMTRSLDFYNNPLGSIQADIILLSANHGFLSPPGLFIQWIDFGIGQNFKPGILGGTSVVNITKTAFDISLQPDKFESGIINVPAIIGLGASIEYLKNLKLKDLIEHIQNMKHYLISHLSKIEQVQLYDDTLSDSTIMSFNFGEESDMGCHDIALFLDQYNISVRSGFLCAHPLISKLSNDGVVQISLHIYNTITDCQCLVESIETIANDFL